MQNGSMHLDPFYAVFPFHNILIYAPRIALLITHLSFPRDHEIYTDGRRYLRSKLIQGIRLDAVNSRGWSEPEAHKHTGKVPCNVCAQVAYANALVLLQYIVVPQLATLRSKERGIDGFVMPPTWISVDLQPPWMGKKMFKTLPLKSPDYVFQHGDIAAHNILIDPQTLKVKALIDWEYAAFYPPGFERWGGTLDKAEYRDRADNVAGTIAELIGEEYLERYNAWGDNAQLEELVKTGEIPHPHEAKLLGERKDD